MSILSPRVVNSQHREIKVEPVNDGGTLRTNERNTVKRKQHFGAVTKTARETFTSTNLQVHNQRQQYNELHSYLTTSNIYS